MTGKTKIRQSDFLKNLGEELFEMNSRAFVRDVDLTLLTLKDPVVPYTKFTPDIAVGYVDTSDFSPMSYLSNEGDALCFAPDDVADGSNWVSFEVPVQPNGKKCAFVIHIRMEIDRAVYPDVFVRNTYTGVQFKSNKVAVLSPKATDMFLVINLDNEIEDEPHIFTMIFTTGSFNLKIYSINYVSM